MSEQKSTPAKHLTSGGLLAKNSIFNLIGQGVPLLAAFIGIPFLVRGMGVDRFGVLDGDRLFQPVRFRLGACSES